LFHLFNHQQMQTHHTFIRIPLVAFILGILGSSTCVYSQQDFNHFQTLISQGSIPIDFTQATSEKINQDIAAKRTDLSATKEKLFLNGIHHSIDQMLHSGSVIYGDEISLYVEAVAKNLLRDEPELLSQLRFYTIKSNETNALSTDQGIVFVTTGLISQLTSEAQLAYILSHEIAHFTEKHVAETFDWKSKNKYEANRIEKLSSYSQEHEFEADKLALKRYHKAGYSDHEIVSTFDVLMYSYLPFDEVEVPSSYFSTENFYIPDSYFATKKYPIKAEEDYNDRKSSHPNIKKRKEASLEGATDFANWGTTLFSQGESTFYYVRNLARFESIRTDMIDAEFGKALYSIFLLEREFTESVYLKRMKAQAWLGLTQFKIANQQNNTIPNSSDYEGESAALYFFIKKLNDEAMMSIGIRTIYDIQKTLSEDPMIAGVVDRLAKTVAESDRFSWDQYATKNFHESAELALIKKDSVKVTEEVVKTDIPTSKYDRIKTKKNINSPESFDSSKFYYYGLSDVVLDSAFRGRYSTYHKEFQAKEAQKAALRKMSAKERYAYEKEREKNESDPMAIGLDHFILVQPSVLSYKHGSVNWNVSEKGELHLNEVVHDAAQKLDIDVQQVGPESIVANGTVSFNERNTLYSLLEQKVHYDEVELFPIDYDALKVIELNYGTSNIMYTAIEHYYDPNINWPFVGYSVLIFPILPITLFVYMPVQFIRGNHTEVTVLTLNTSSGSIRNVTNVELRHKPKKLVLGSVYYNLFKQLSTKK